MIGRVSDVDLRLVRIFVSVAEAGGFSLATARLNISESAVSQHMSDLEMRLGVRLCERGRSGFRLTKAGEEVHRVALELLQDVEQFRDRISALRSDLSGTLNLGIPDGVITFEGLGILEAIRRYCDRDPEATLNLQMLTPRDLERGVSDGRLHLAISAEHRRVAGLDYARLSGERNSLYCGQGHPLFSLPDVQITMVDLENTGRISRGYLERFDAEVFKTHKYRATVLQIEAAALLILSGRLIGFLPDHYASQWIENGLMRALKPAECSFVSQFSIITRRNEISDARIAAFLEEMSRGRRIEGRMVSLAE